MGSVLPLLEISGAPRERGRAHGEERLTRARALEISETYLGPAEAYAADLLEEVRGIAEGANAPFQEVLALNAFLDLFDYLSGAFMGGRMYNVYGSGKY